MGRKLLLVLLAIPLAVLAGTLAIEDGTEPFGEAMGINEAVSVPVAMIERSDLGLEEIGPLWEQDARAVSATGARWVRLHSSNHPFTNQLHFGGFPALDRWVQAVQAEGLHAVVVISPWSGNRTSRETPEYVLPDEQAWAAWVRAIVERYDGDGEQDMPGLREPIRHWEVDNEPDLKNAPIGGERDPTFCTVEQYAQVLRLTAQAIRGADSGARVLNGGIYRPHRPEGKQYLSELIEQAGSSIDILSVHSYPEDLDTFLRGVDTALEHADQRPVWITETSVSSKGGEDWQAEMLEAMVTAALDRGVERIFWHTLNDPPERAKRPVGMSSHSLYHHGMVPKEAARVWQRLAMGAL